MSSIAHATRTLSLSCSPWLSEAAEFGAFLRGDLAAFALPQHQKLPNNTSQNTPFGVKICTNFVGIGVFTPPLHSEKSLSHGVVPMGGGG